MPLKMRPTGLGHGVYKDTSITAYSAASGASAASTRPAPAPPICAGSGRCTLPASQEPAHRNRVATLDEAKAEFEASWKQWKAWAGMEEAPNPPRTAG